MTKSKSLMTTFAMVLLLIVATFGFVGCGPAPITTTKIEITESTVDTIVKKGSTFSTTDIVVKAVRSDQSELTLKHENLTFSTVDTTSAGTKTLVVTYVENEKDYKDSIDVLVYGDLTGIAVKAGSYNTTGYQGFTYNPGNIVIVATYEGGYSQEVTTGFAVGSLDTTTAGEKDLTVSYTVDGVTKTTTAPVTISSEELQSIEITAYAPDVAQGATYDTSSVVVKGDFGGTLTPLDTADYTLSTVDTTEVGEVDLVATYNQNTSKTDTVKVKVYGELLSISIKSGTIDTSIAAPTDFDISELVIVASYEGGVSKELTTGFTTNAALLTSSYAGNSFDFIVTMGGKEAIETISIGTYTVFSMEDPIAISTGYNVNSSASNKNTFTDFYGEGKKGFEETGKTYVVGSSNAFIYEPVLMVMYPGQATGTSITDFEWTAEVFLWEGAAYGAALQGNALSEYVVVDGEAHTFDFTEAAEGKKFKISVMPVDAANVEASEFEFEVIEGYNIYTAADLSAIDNANLANKWTDYKNANGIPLNVETNSFILHRDIVIERSDLPSMHYYTAADALAGENASYVAGSLKDASDIGPDPIASVYKRVLDEGEDFVLEGNYFTISAQNVPLIYREWDTPRTDPTAAITTHTTLFAVMAKDAAVQKYSAIEAKVIGAGESVSAEKPYATIEEAEEAMIETSAFNNVALIGNSNKSEDALKSGGIIMGKFVNVKSTFYNNLSQSWFTTYFHSGNSSIAYETDEKSCYLDMTLDKVNAFDAYSTIIYSWGGDLNIRNSHLIGAGGPVMICDHVDNDANGNGGFVSSVAVDEASVLQSYVAGTEGWFNTYTAANALFAGIKAQNAFFAGDAAQDLAGIGKTFVKTEKGVAMINMIAAFKSGEAQDATSSFIQTSFSVEGSDVDLEMFGNNEPSYEKLSELAVMSGLLASPYTLGQMAIAAGGSLDDVDDSIENLTVKQLIEATQQQAAAGGQNLTTYQAFMATINAPGSELLLNTFNAQVASNLTAIQGTTQGIVYYTANGGICMPNGTDGWVSGLEPNADLFEDYEGYLYANIYGKIGAVMTIENVPASQD